VRLVATDVEWAHGTGAETRRPMQSHLLTLTGRQSAAADTTAAG
jgi:hypothetical protein